MRMRIFYILSILALFYQPAFAVGGDFYDETILRTLQLEFPQADWWSRLEANSNTEENITATLIVDDVAYEGVGVHFRGMTSDSMTNDSQKKSFNIEIDYTIEDQRVMGYKTLNLINSFDDPTFKGETVWLYDTDERGNALLDSASFGSLREDQSYGRYPDAQGDMQIL